VFFTTQEIFKIVRSNISDHLSIDPEVVDFDFRFHYFIDRIAAKRQQFSGQRSSSDYVEAACIYMDLTEHFAIEFFTEYTSTDCRTVGDLVKAIESKLIIAK
jgi:acyl carrier protein